MAMSSRILSRSRQIYASQAVFSGDNAISVRTFAKEASPDKLPPLKGDEMLKGIFLNVKKKFDIALSVLKREKITIDPDDPKAVFHYSNVMRTVRREAGLLNDSQRIQATIWHETSDIPDARSYLLKLQEIRAKNGLIDHLGAEKLMMAALDKVEKEIKKPLLRNDKQNTPRLLAEFEKINKKLGIDKEDLTKLEKRLEVKVAVAELRELKKNAVEAMETQLKREEFKDEKMPDIRSLDIRNFL